MSTKRGKHTCTMVDNEIIVVGDWIPGDKTVEIFDLDSLSWRSGPDLEIAYHVALPYQDSFIVIGGLQPSNTDESYNTIYKYDKVNEQWVLLDERLADGRMDFDAVYYNTLAVALCT